MDDVEHLAAELAALRDELLQRRAALPWWRFVARRRITRWQRRVDARLAEAWVILR